MKREWMNPRDGWLIVSAACACVGLVALYQVARAVLHGSLIAAVAYAITATIANEFGYAAYDRYRAECSAWRVRQAVAASRPSSESPRP